MDRGDFLNKWTISKKEKGKLLALIFGILLLVFLVLSGQGEEGEKQTAEKEKKKEQAEVETEIKRPETIRVLLKNSNYSSIYHQEVTLTSDAVMQVTQKETVQTVATGEAFSVKWEKEAAENSTENADNTEETNKADVMIEGGNLSVASIKRGEETPVYAGKLEIFSTDSGYVLVNEVDFETYVKGVVPGEMPASYETEALKAQAICARTYGIMKLQGEQMYGEYKANLDDSVQCQVYKSKAESESTSRAVEETAGEILTYNGEIAATYYFSTSWGYTTGMDAWLKEEVPYLSAAAVGDADTFTVEALNAKNKEAFEEVFSSPEGTFYEEKEPWYRWQISVDLEENREALFKTLLAIQKERPEEILVWSEEKQEYIAESPVAFETIKSIEVTKRGSGGVVCNIEITTDKQKLQIKGQHTIRALFAFPNNQIIRQDQSVVKNLSLLPSGFFLLETEKEEDNVKKMKLSGGGFGHGVGMSQNGANQMAILGKDYKEILSFFYRGAEIGNLK